MWKGVRKKRNKGEGLSPSLFFTFPLSFLGLPCKISVRQERSLSLRQRYYSNWYLPGERALFEVSIILNLLALFWLFVLFQKPIQPRVDEATLRSIRDSSTKLPSQVNKSDTRSRNPRQAGVNIVSAAAVRSANSRSSKTSFFQGSPKTVSQSSGSGVHMPSNPRRNPPTFYTVDGISVNSGRGKLQGTNLESQTRDPQSSTQPKRTTKKKVV